MTNSHFFRILLPLTSHLTFPFPMAFITRSVLGVFINVSMLTPCGFQNIDSCVFQRSSFPYSLCDGKTSQIASLRLRRYLRWVTIMGRNTISCTFVIFYGVLRVLMINNGRSRDPFLIRAFRCDFNGNASGLQLHASSRLVGRSRTAFVTAFRRCLRVNRIEKMNARVIFSELFVASVCRGTTRCAYVATFIRQGRRTTLWRVLRWTCHFRAS